MTTTKYRDIDTQEEILGAFKRLVLTMDGTDINDTISFPRNFLKNATDQQLVDLGIEKYEEADPEPDPPTIDDLYPPLVKYQFDAMIDYLGLEDDINAALDAMPDGIEKSVAKSLFKNGDRGRYRRSNPLFASLSSSELVDIDEDGINTAWTMAVNL